MMQSYPFPERSSLFNRQFDRSFVFGDDPDSVNNTGDVSQQGEEQIQPEVLADADLEKNPQGRQNDDNDDFEQFHLLIPFTGIGFNGRV